MEHLFISLKNLKRGYSFKIPSFDGFGGYTLSRDSFKVVGKMLTKFKCINTKTSEIIYLPLDTYVRIVIYK